MMKEIKDLYRVIAMVYKTVSQQADPWCKNTCPEDLSECVPVNPNHVPDGPWPEGACHACRKCNDFYDNTFKQYCKQVPVLDENGQPVIDEGNPVLRPQTIEEIIKKLDKNGACEGCKPAPGYTGRRASEQAKKPNCLKALAEAILQRCGGADEIGGTHPPCQAACDQCVGACCERITGTSYGGYSCSQKTEADCASNDENIFKGEGVPCGDDTCNHPADEGACCHEGGTCTDGTRAACDAAGGTFKLAAEGQCSDPGICDDEDEPVPESKEGYCCYMGTCAKRIDSAGKCGAEGGEWKVGPPCEGYNDPRCQVDVEEPIKGPGLGPGIDEGHI